MEGGGSGDPLLQGADELPLSELEGFVEAGMFNKVKKHVEHLALHPFWLTKPRQGVMEELKKGLGKWNPKLDGYVVGVDGVRIESDAGELNEDHQWVHLNVKATFYLYRPEEGQVLRGVIKKKGVRAAICVLFGVFTATVYPVDDDELEGWMLEDEILFTIQSFHNRRKGPIIKGTSSSDHSFGSSVTQRKTKKKTEPELQAQASSFRGEESWE